MTNQDNFLDTGLIDRDRCPLCGGLGRNEHSTKDDGTISNHTRSISCSVCTLGQFDDTPMRDILVFKGLSEPERNDWLESKREKIRSRMQ